MIELSRRVFVRSGLAACSAGALIRPIARQNSVIRYYKAVFDERFEDPCRFAGEAAARNIATVGIRSDITKLFFHDLDLRWKQGPVWLIGFTTAASLFCLDLLARDRGMRLCHCATQPSVDAAIRVLNGAPPRRSTISHLPPRDPENLVFWIIAPSSPALPQEAPNA